ncbi:MAG: tetratricopeptide repeat protein, partial [Desulfococcaceae bacterium]|nr:tetratricopeptide repeat protein [Desulfococcaceae bacterium]
MNKLLQETQHYSVSDSFSKAFDYHKKGELEAAEKMYRDILAKEPEHADALHLSGLAAHQKGDPHRALTLIEKAVKLSPDPVYFSNLGAVYQALRRFQKAELYHKKALELNPGLIASHFSLGNIYKGLGCLPEALMFYQNVIKLKQDHGEAHYNAGIIFQWMGNYSEAEKCYRRVIKLQPDFAEVYNNLGTVCQCQGRKEEAFSSYRKALSLRPDYADVYNNMGTLFQAQGQIDKAVTAYRQAVRFAPDHADAYGNLVFQLYQTCRWKELETLNKKLDRLSGRLMEEGKKISETPFVNLIRHMNPERNFAVARSWTQHILRQVAHIKCSFSFENRKNNGTKIVIGYLSNDFRNHPVAHLMLGLFGFHDRRAFEIHCYSFGKDDGSIYRRRIEKECDRFVELHHLNHETAAKCIYENNVDILVDLMGHTKDNRLEICALRPSPVQVTWLGCPGTTGADFMDYIITDRIVTPEDQARYYSEKFVWMPHSYVVMDNTQVLPPNSLSRKDFQLPEDAFVFCSFNNAYKIDPLIFSVWMNILRRVEGSVLWIMVRDSVAQKNLQKEAGKKGIDTERLIFADKLPKDKHLNRLQLADLALDTRIYNGGATTCDALWAGVPVITVQGNHLASRVSSGILAAADLAELICKDLHSYEELAVEIASVPPKIKRFRECLQKNRNTAPLFDTEKYVRALEAAFRAMMQLFRSGQQAKHISVDETKDGQRIRKRYPAKVKERINQGVACHQKGDLDGALDIYREIQRDYPDHPDPLHLSGIIAHQKGNGEEALHLIQQAIEIHPRKASYHSNLGLVLQSIGQIDGAMNCFRKATEIAPDFAEARNNMGNAFQALARPDLAEPFYREAIELNPQYAEAWHHLGLALQDMLRSDEALAAYRKAVEIRPDFAEVYYSMATVFQAREKTDDAVSLCRKALAYQPEHAKAFGLVYHYLQQTCQWKELQQADNTLDEMTRNSLEKGASVAEQPLMSIMRHSDPRRNYEVIRARALEIQGKAENIQTDFSFENRKSGKSRIIVGYLSNDFRNHPVAHLALRLFGLQDRKRFQVYAYSYGPGDGSTYREQIRESCDCFRDIRRMNNSDAARCIYEDGVDILVDLTGHTRDERLIICALRPAPVQVTYLGFPGTTAADFMDYIITDRIVTPEDHKAFYSEQFVYMPDCYMITDHQQEVSSGQWRKSDLGVTEDTFIFCSLNNAYKIEPVMFDVWMRVLHQIPDSVLWLQKFGSETCRNLKKEAEKRGVHPDRLIFAEKLRSKADYLGRLALAELGLDTRIYNGHATTCDALWAGVPVVTLQGNHFASRAASAILTAAGLEELITYDLRTYEELVLRLAKNRNEIISIREKLQNNRLREPLFDTPGFVMKLETAYESMWQQFLEGKNPELIDVRRERKKNFISALTSDVESDLQQAVSLHQENRFQEAEKLYRKIIAQIPDHADALHLLGLIFFQKGNSSKAVELICKAIEKSPSNPIFYSNLGLAYKLQYKTDEALSSYEKALELTPNDPEICYRMGKVLRETG